MNKIHQFQSAIGGSEIIVEIGRLAGQAGGAMTVRSGDTILLATATAASPRSGIDFFPLTVNFEERLYAAGKIPGGFFRREGRPTERATLTCRLVDRPIRPLFPDGFRNEVQVVITPLSADQETYLDILAIIGASAALTISDIPFGGPVGAVRVGYMNDEFVFNPTMSEMEHSTLNLRMAGTRDAIVMVEADAHQVSEAMMIEALKRGHEAIQDVVQMQVEMGAQIGKPKAEYEPYTINEETYQLVQEKLGDRLSAALIKARSLDKAGHRDTMTALFDELVTELGLDEEEDKPYTRGEVREIYDDLIKKEVRRAILDERIRPDGRTAATLRPLNCEVGLSPRVHGTGLFTRGETQVLTSATLGTGRDEQIIDDLSPEESKRYMHHYNFPPYSTGEVRPMRGPRRREIGHGALAEHALLPVLPNEEEFPYTMRLVSDVMSSNGSTSMASVCGSTLALMDAGVPIKDPVAGIAMGLIKEDNRYVTLTDIQGMEDHLGDMDFKVAGTRKGITALQMDIKIRGGMSYAILEQALAQAREARMIILDKMEETIPAPRAELSPYAPRITMIKIDPDKIGAVIGPGGKTIRAITEKTGVKIEIEDDGTVLIASTDGPASKRAVEMIERLVEEPEVGKIYLGRITKIADFGAFAEILPKHEGLIHISQLADYRVRAVHDVVAVGDEVMVMVVDVNTEGKISLSRQAVLENWTLEQARRSDPKLSGGRGRGRRGRDDRYGGSRRPSGRRRY